MNKSGDMFFHSSFKEGNSKPRKAKTAFSIAYQLSECFSGGKKKISFPQFKIMWQKNSKRAF